MGLFFPLLLLFGLIAIPIIVFYMLRPRRNEHRISSTFFWREDMQHIKAKSRWRSLRFNILLLLQLLVLTLLVLALSRPFIQSESQTPDHVILLLDTSASMQATDVIPSRFAVAQKQAIRFIESLTPENEITIILMEDIPRILINKSTDSSSLKRTIEETPVGVKQTNLTAALSLSASLIDPKHTTSIVVLSDGNFENPRIDKLPFEINHIPIRRSNDNLAIEAFSATHTSTDIIAMARIAKYGSLLEKTTVELYVEDILHETRLIDLATVEDTEVRWQNIPQGSQLLEVRLKPEDFLALDNRAWALTGDSNLIAKKILLVGNDNIFLETALKLNQQVEIVKTPPEQIPSSLIFNLWIFNGYLPNQLPSGPILVINPPAETSHWAVGEPSTITDMRINEHELLQFTDLSSLEVMRASPVTVPSEAKILVSSAEGPLISVWESLGRKIALFSFDLGDSNLPFEPTFPILIHNIFDWLTSNKTSSIKVHPGQILEFPLEPGTQAAWIRLPDGDSVALAPPFPAKSFATTEQIGVYQLVQEMEGHETVDNFVVNLFTPKESDLTIYENISSLGKPSDIDTKATKRVSWELVSLLVLAAFIILGIEWWVYNRGDKLR